MKREAVLIIDFGGQYNQLIARRVREHHVYCELKSYTVTLDEIRAFDPIGIIFTGGPGSVYAPGAPQVDPVIFDLGVPILGICYGCQLMAHHLGGQVTPAQDDAAREYGKTHTYFDTDCRLFRGLPAESVTWMSHGDYMARVPEGFSLAAHSDNCPNVAIADEARGFYGVQYHPEVNHTEYGAQMLKNFLYEVCGAHGTWTMGDYKKTAVAGGPVGGRGFLRGGGAAGGGRWQPAHLRVRGPWPDAQGRGRRGGGGLCPMARQLRAGQRRKAVFGQAGRGHGAGAQAQDHRRGIHPSL